jgi:hypothetical protein
MNKKGPSTRLSSGWTSGGISGIREEEFLEGLGKRPGGVLTVKIRQPSHEFTSGVGITFVSYSLVLTPVV